MARFLLMVHPSARMKAKMIRSRQTMSRNRQAEGAAPLTKRLGRPMRIESLERRCPMDASLGDEFVSPELAPRILDDALIACELSTMPVPVSVQPDSSSPHEPTLPQETPSTSQFVAEPELPPVEDPLFEADDPFLKTDESELGGQGGMGALQETDMRPAGTDGPPVAFDENDSEPMVGDGEEVRTLIDPIQVMPWGSIDTVLGPSADRLPSNQVMQVSHSAGGVRLLSAKLDSFDASSSGFTRDDASLTDTIYFKRNDETDADEQGLESVAASLSLRRFSARSNLAGSGISIGPIAAHTRDVRSKPSLTLPRDREERVASVSDRDRSATRRCDLPDRRDLLDRASEALVDLALKALVQDASRECDDNTDQRLANAAEALAVTGLVQPFGGQAASRESKSDAKDSRTAGAPTLEFARNLCRIAVLGFVLTQHGMLKKANADILKGCLKR
jgi:hypothetical protein